jgi:hypothetical protein
VSKLQARSRRSFLNKTNKRTLSHGIITPEMERLHTSGPTPIPEAQTESPLTLAGRLSKDGGESLDRTESSGTGDDEAPAAPRVVSGASVNGGGDGSVRGSLDTPKADSERRKSGVLRKLRLSSN